MQQLWWRIQFAEPYSGRQGYLAWTNDRREEVAGVYFEDGALVPSDPDYVYTTIDTEVSPPTWAEVA